MNKKKTIHFIKKYYYILLTMLPFLAIDIYIRILGRNINYFNGKIVLPNILFTASWLILFLAVVLCLKSKAGKFVYWALFILFFALYLTNGIYYKLTGFFFGFNLIFMAGDGISYVWDAIITASPLLYILGIIIIALAVLGSKSIPKKEKSDWRTLFFVFIAFIVVHTVTPLFLGTANSSLEWDSWRNPRNVYNDFNDSNKNMKICGIFEYSFRDFYVTFLRPDDAIDDEEIEYLENTYSQTEIADTNDYTGMFSGKNLILLQLEGMDNWMITPEYTPTLYKMMQESINFENHYSYYNGGGSTFNSEFAVNTGFITPISYTKNAYSFHTNTFKCSLANMFKNQGYSVNAFHMNTGEYYQRSINYKNWGYDNYYGLLDANDYDDLSYELDRELILDEDFYRSMFVEADEPFVHSIITYTPHTPFTTSKGTGQLLAEYEYGEDNVPDLSEEECAMLMAKETDYMVELLLQALNDNGLIDDTVIILYADHYLYTLNDKSVLDKYKTTDNNLINNTPFFIWSSDIQPETVTKVNSQLDILPTVLNLFGIEYTSDYYIGNDIFNSDYCGYVFFDDYSWYDGNVYVENGVITNNGSMGDDELEEMNDMINDIIRKNDLTLKYDYLKKIIE